MEAQIQNMRGLAKVIFEEMVYASELVPNPSALWTPDNFMKLREGLRERLAPEVGDNSKTFFNMVFDRSFFEARTIFEDMIHMTEYEQCYPQVMFATA